MGNDTVDNTPNNVPKDPWDSIEERYGIGSKHTGLVVKVTEFYVIVKLDKGVYGRVKRNELSWRKNINPEDVVKKGEYIDVLVLKINWTKKILQLGHRQFTPHPWESLDEKLKVGDHVRGKVVVIADYGAFVEIAPDIHGLLHVSEMTWSRRKQTAHDLIHIGDEIEAEILTLDRNEHKMSLGIRYQKADPWIDIEEKYPIGSRHSTKVLNITNYGIFVELEEGVDGMVHISDLSLTHKAKHPSDLFQKGDPIDVIVLNIDKENHRLSLKNIWEQQ